MCLNYPKLVHKYCICYLLPNLRTLTGERTVDLLRMAGPASVSQLTILSSNKSVGSGVLATS